MTQSLLYVLFLLFISPKQVRILQHGHEKKLRPALYDITTKEQITLKREKEQPLSIVYFSSLSFLLASLILYIMYNHTLLRWHEVLLCWCRLYALV